MVRLVFVVLALLSVVIQAHAQASPPSEQSQKYINNAILKVRTSGMKNGWFVTGSGVNFTAAAEAQFDSASADTSWNLLEITNFVVKIGGVDATVYPLSGDSALMGGFSQPSTGTGIGRKVRFDSVRGAASLTGTATNIVLTATFKLRKVWNPPPTPTNPQPGLTDLVDPREETVQLTVTPLAINSLLATGTNRNVSGSSNMAAYNLPAGYDWASVSQEMASTAAGLVPHHAQITGELHTKGEMITDPKLLDTSTCWFNSTHGMTGGVYDNTAAPASMLLLGWSDLAGVLSPNTKSNVSSAANGLHLNMAFLYSCEAANSSSFTTSLLGTDSTNQAAFGFKEVVFSSLKSSDATDPLPYNDQNGDVIMLDKLTTHVTKMLLDLASGLTSEQATDAANAAHPPRAFASEANHINYMKVLKMSRTGDAKARLTSVYRPEPTTDYVRYGSSILVFKAVVIL